MNIKDLVDNFFKNKIDNILLVKCREIINDDTIAWEAYKNSDENPTIEKIKEKKFLVWAERTTIEDETKIEIKKYLFGYMLRHEKDTISVCFESVLIVLCCALLTILVMAWVFDYFEINKLALFTIDMAFCVFAGYILYSMYGLSYSSKYEQDDIRIYTYNNKIEKETINFKNIEQENIEKSLILYMEYKVNISQYLPILISGFFLLLLTFSFYTSSLIMKKVPSQQEVFPKSNINEIKKEKNA